MNIGTSQRLQHLWTGGNLCEVFTNRCLAVPIKTNIFLHYTLKISFEYLYQTIWRKSIFGFDNLHIVGYKWLILFVFVEEANLPPLSNVHWLDDPRDFIDKGDSSSDVVKGLHISYLFPRHRHVL